MTLTQTRRRFLITLPMAGTAGLVHVPRALDAEGALETTAVRVVKVPGICVAPQYVAEELLRAEGFTDVRYVDPWPTGEFSQQVGKGEEIGRASCRERV